MMTGHVATTAAPDVQEEGWAVGEIENSALVRVSYGLISVVGVVGNLLVCLVMLRVPSLRSNTSDFLVHLAAVDFMVCLWVIPFHLFPHVPSSSSGLLGEMKCRMYTSKFPLWATMLTSIFNLVVVNLERYVAIVYPHRYKTTYRPMNKYLMLVACWVLALATNGYFFLVYDVEDDTGSCLYVGWGSAFLQAAAGVYVMTTFVVGPIAFMAATQWRVISMLNEQVRKLTANQRGTENNANKQREMWQLRASQQLQKTMISVMITYAVCWAPINTIFLAFNLGATVNFAAPYYHACVILGVCNSCLNPIIYTVRNGPFRTGILRLFRCRGARPGPGQMASLSGGAAGDTHTKEMVIEATDSNV